LLGALNEKTKRCTLNHRKLKKDVRRHKTVWWERRHDAGVHGTNVVNNLLGKRGLFPFPKSVYAVQDSLAAVVRNRPNALILDFFAGSGTTFHATCLLNAEDGGSRRSVLVTNNEVEERTARELQKQGIFRGNPEFEKHGIFTQVTRPRCETVVTGLRADHTKVGGAHIDGRPFAQGFEENVEFFRIDYLDPDEVDLGTQFEAIFPSLWLSAGGVGVRPKMNDPDMLVPASGTYAVLYREERFRKFLAAITGREDLTHVWIVTDSEDAFAEMRAALRPDLVTSMLYRDYLRNFRINTRQNR
jgi:adenine-specific DNA-methyltransferase